MMRIIARHCVPLRARAYDDRGPSAISGDGLWAMRASVLDDAPTADLRPGSQGRGPAKTSGIEAFRKRYPKAKIWLIGGGGIKLEDFSTDRRSNGSDQNERQMIAGCPQSPIDPTRHSPDCIETVLPQITVQSARA